MKTRYSLLSQYLPEKMLVEFYPDKESRTEDERWTPEAIEFLEKALKIASPEGKQFARSYCSEDDENTLHEHEVEKLCKDAVSEHLYGYHSEFTADYLHLIFKPGFFAIETGCSWSSGVTAYFSLE